MRAIFDIYLIWQFCQTYLTSLSYIVSLSYHNLLSCNSDGENNQQQYEYVLYNLPLIEVQCISLSVQYSPITVRVLS